MHGGAAHAARNWRAIRASGAIIRVAPAEFVELLRRGEEPLVVVARGGFLRRGFRYLTSYKGLTFHTRSDAELVLPRGCEVVLADRIWIPEQ